MIVKTKEKPTALRAVKIRAKTLRQETSSLYLAFRDPRTPLYAKLLVILVVAYAISPIDLIPDFIPILGYLDDLILVPLGIALALKMIPKEVMEDCRARVASSFHVKSKAPWVAATLIIAFWCLAAFWIIQLIPKKHATG